MAGRFRHPGTVDQRGAADAEQVLADLGVAARATYAMTTNRDQIEITGFAKFGGPLTKRITLSLDGAIHSDGSACVMSIGWACRARFRTLAEFAAHIAALGPNEAIALGALRDGLPDKVEVTTKDRIDRLNGTATPGLIARTGDHIVYRPGLTGLALIDIDTKGMPAAITLKIDALGGFLSALISILPQLKVVGHVVRRSTSTGISRTDTGGRLRGSDGLHAFVLVNDATDIERFLRTLHARCWLHGFGWMMVGAGGQLLERSLVDRMVYAPERLVFEAAPILDPPLVQDRASRAPEVIEGPSLDTRVACPNLSLIEQAKLLDTLAERRRLTPEAEKVRGAFIAQHAERIVARTGCRLNAARSTVEHQCGGVLLPRVLLAFDATEYEGATVGDVLADPDRFVSATLADPLEGPEYGRCKAKVMRRPDGTLWINSFAHGRATYELKHDAASIEATLRVGDPADAADRFVRLLLAAEMQSDDEQRLRELVTTFSGVKARPLGAKIKVAREDQAKQRARSERERRSAERTDSRVRLAVPLPDAELLPIARAIDDVLHSARLAEPPTRDLDLWPVEVRAREAFRLHGITTRGVNPEE